MIVGDYPLIAEMQWVVIRLLIYSLYPVFSPKFGYFTRTANYIWLLSMLAFC